MGNGVALDRVLISLLAFVSFVGLAGCTNSEAADEGPQESTGPGYETYEPYHFEPLANTPGPVFCWDLDGDGRRGPDDDANGDGAVNRRDCH